MTTDAGAASGRDSDARAASGRDSDARAASGRDSDAGAASGRDSDAAEGLLRRALALSPSRAADFKQCPLRYRYRAIDRLPETPTPAMARGTLVHAALEHLFGMPAALRTLESADFLVDGAWDALRESDPVLDEVVGEADRDRFLADAHKLMATYFTMEDPTAFDPEAVEQRVETVSHDLPMRGFIDRLDVAPTGEIRIVDYKTGRSPGAGYESQAMFQMKFYALAVLRIRGELPARLQLMYLADGQMLTYTPDHAELDRFERTLAAIWRAISSAVESGHFPAKRSWQCRTCDHQSRCPEFGGTVPAYPGAPAA